MRRIFLSDLSDEELTIGGDDAHHLAYSLRAKRGDKITAVDATGNSAVIELVDFERDKIKARRISELQPVVVEREIILADCLPKQNRFETIIEKATELGVNKIAPLIAERTIVRPDDDRAAARFDRWQRIAKESAEQCARDTIPEISELRGLDDWLKEPLADDMLLLFCWESEQTTTAREVLSDYRATGGGKIVVLIGPEGGFSQREVDAIKSAGGKSVTLGKRVLKTDTAAISVLAMINYEFM